MSALLVAHLVAAGAYAGFQWTVQVLVYRQFAAVAAADFPAYERSHQQRISWLVGPLFLAQVATTAGLVLVRPQGVPLPGALAAAALLAVVLLVTAAVAAPLHGRLGRQGYDEGLVRRLLRADAVRTAAATAQVALAAALALAAG